MISISAGGRRWARTTTWAGALLLAAGVPAGCASATHPHPDAQTGTASRHARTVRISGYSLRIRCTGPSHPSAPTIVLLAGVTQPLTAFTFIQSRLSSLTRVCSYDRPGEGTSSEPRGSQTLAGSAATLHLLLARLNVASHGIILVGHSLGGQIAATYASRYRADHQVRALVLLDATPPSLAGRALRLIPPGTRGPAGQFRSWVAGFRSGRDRERLVLPGTIPAPIGDVPLIVVQHGRPIFTGVAGYGPQLEKVWSEGQRAWLRLSQLSRMVIARRSGHVIYRDQPLLTLRVIRQALSEAG